MLLKGGLFMKKISCILSVFLCFIMVLLSCYTGNVSMSTHHIREIPFNYNITNKNSIDNIPTDTPAASVKNPINISVAYSGAPITAPTTLTKDDLTVTAYYSDGSTETITDYTFLSSTTLASPGNYTITVFYYGMKASCVVVFNDSSLPSTYTITLDSNGGSSIPSITDIPPNATISYPDTPVYYGYRFRGWFTSPDFTTEFSEYDKITSNLTLYAKWEKKENPDKDIFTNLGRFNSYAVTIRADLTGQKFGRYVNLDTRPLENGLIERLCKNVCSSSKYFGIALHLCDYTFCERTPALITISIPPTFDSSKVAVYYSTNNVTIAGKMQGTIAKADINGQDSFSFYAYAPGTYIMAETDTIQTPGTNNNPKDTPYITMASIGKVKIHSQIAPNIQLHNSSKNISEIDVKWSSSKPSVASVSKDGVVTALSIGTATITVQSVDGTMTASKEITVTTQKPVTSLTLNVKKKTLKKGKSFQIKAAIKPTNATRKTLSYSSSDTSVAKVSKKGKIVARKKGTCIITVKTTDGSKLSKTIKITVKK